MFHGNQVKMASALSVDAQEFVPVVNGQPHDHSKLCSSLSVDAPAFVPVVVSTSEIIPDQDDNHEENFLSDAHWNQESKSSIQRRGRFAQIDTRNQQKHHKSIDIFSKPQINKKDNNKLVQSSLLGSCNSGKINESAEKKKNTFSLAEYSKRQRPMTGEQEKNRDDNININSLKKKMQDTNFLAGESKPIILWSAIVKKEPSSEKVKLDDSNDGIPDIAPYKNYSKNKVARRKKVLSEGVLSDAPNDRYKLFYNDEKKEDWKEEDMLEIMHNICSPLEHNKIHSMAEGFDCKTKKKLLNKAPGTSIPRLPIQEGKKGKRRNGDKLRKSELGNKQGLPSTTTGDNADENHRSGGKNDSMTELTKTDLCRMNKAKKSIERSDELCRCANINNIGKRKNNIQIEISEDKNVLDSSFEVKPISVKSSERLYPNDEMRKEILLTLNICDSLTFPQLSLGSLASTSKPLSYSAVAKKGTCEQSKCAFNGNMNINNVNNNVSLSEEEKRLLKKKQKALKRKRKVKQKKEEAKLNKTIQTVSEKLEKVTDKERTFDLSDMFTKLLKMPAVERSDRKTGKGKNVKMSTGVISVVSGLAKKNSPRGRKVERNKYGSTHTIMDGTTIRKRGKERETPKKKRPTLLKKVITAERKRKQELLEEKSLVGIEISERGIANHANSDPESGGKITKYPEDIWKKIHSKKFREYCDQVITKQINHLTYNLLLTLQKFQDRVYHENPIKYKQKRRFILGLREVLKHLKLKRIKAVIIAPNIERISGKGGLDDYLGSIIAICNEQEIPKIFAMNRHILGRVIKKLAPVSVVGIFDYDGAHEIFKELIALVRLAKITYMEKVNAIDNDGSVMKMVNVGSQLKIISSDKLLDPFVNNDQQTCYKDNDIKQNILDKLYTDKCHLYDTGSESDAWITDNENAL